MESYRIGYGSDIHPFAPYRTLFLCGCKIPCRLGGLLGHSDADVAVHALIDAMLGALALGDIGHFFPDTDPEWKDASGETLLSHVLAMPEFKLWHIGNVDMTILAEEPKMAPHILRMRTSLAKMLGIESNRISVKAKTGEGLDAVGKCEAIEARVVLLMVKNEK